MREEKLSAKKKQCSPCSRCAHTMCGHCPHQESELMFLPEDLEGIRKHGVAGYELILFIDAKTRRAVILSNVSGRLGLLDLKKDSKIHRHAWLEALRKGSYSYEWSFEKDGQISFYQTTCLSLFGSDGKILGVLSLTRDISEWGAGEGGNILKEGTSPRTFSQILLAARETEKKEISKALHDEIGSTAVILTSLLSIVRAHVKNGDQKRALTDIAKLGQQIKESIERVKNIVVSLRPLNLENDGALGEAVRELLENISGLTRIPYTFDYHPLLGGGKLSDNIKILFYRIVQEALNNIVKHAQASHIYVRLESDPDEVHLVIQDDGIGFKMAKKASIRHVGLLAMKDSVQLMGGEISIKTAPGKGTRIEVSCPRVVYGGNQ